jgi:hypothetical protein
MFDALKHALDKEVKVSIAYEYLNNNVKIMAEKGDKICMCRVTEEYLNSISTSILGEIIMNGVNALTKEHRGIEREVINT